MLPGPTREPITGSFLVLVVEDEALLALDLELTILRQGWRVLVHVQASYCASGGRREQR